MGAQESDKAGRSVKSIVQAGAEYYSRIVDMLDPAYHQEPFVIWRRRDMPPGTVSVQGSLIMCSTDVADAIIAWELFSGIASQ
jgi:hypothetical protein